MADRDIARKLRACEAPEHTKHRKLFLRNGRLELTLVVNTVRLLFVIKMQQNLQAVGTLL